MKNNLYSVYQNIYKTPRIWKYYKNLNISKDFEISGEFAEEFIKSYFDFGHKGLPSLADKMTELRYRHTLSSFFIGLEIYEKLKLKSAFEVKVLKNRPFNYCWFLTCLCHDVACLLEEKKKEKGKIERLLDNSLSFLSLPKSLREQVNYTAELFVNYNNYIRATREHCDHGIVGAAKYYKTLSDFHHKVVEKEKRKYPDINQDDLTIHGIRFSSDSLNIFAQIASVIACHNIWFGKEKDRDNYERYHLDELINHSKLKVYDDALLFWILIIADTIEPIKRGGLSCTDEILNKISIHCSPHTSKDDYEVKECSIKLTCQNSLCPSLVSAWMHSIETLEDWTEIKITTGGKTNKWIELCFKIYPASEE